MKPPMSSERPQGLRTGHLIALAGALATLVSLWRPWYAIEVPQALRDALAADGARASGSFFGSFAQTLASALPERVQASGWQELRGADMAMCVAALAAAALILGASGAFGAAVRIERQAAARWIAAIGGVALLVAVQHVLVRPGGDFGIDVQLADGLWIAVAGSAAMAAGGWSAASPES